MTHGVRGSKVTGSRPRSARLTAALTAGVLVLTLTPASAHHYDDFPPARNKPQVVDVEVLVENGGRAEAYTDPQGDSFLAFDRKGGTALDDDPSFDVWILDMQTGVEECLTCGYDPLPQGVDIGQPTWHPSGEWLVVQAFQEGAPSGSAVTGPGGGVYNDLWMIRVDGTAAVRIHKIDTTGQESGRGSLHPRFNADGTRLVFSEYQGAFLGGAWPPPDAEQIQHALNSMPNRTLGEFTVNVADVVWDADGLPRLENMQRHQPGIPGLYENHGFAPDEQGVLLSGTPDRGQAGHAMDILVMGLEGDDEGQIIRRITQSHTTWDEHAYYPPTQTSYDGRVVYSSNHGLEIAPQFLWPYPALYGGFLGPIGEHWVAEPDGSTWRLTDFNNPDWEHRPDYDYSVLYPARFSFLDPQTILTFVVTKQRPLSVSHPRSPIFLIHLSEPL